MYTDIHETYCPCGKGKALFFRDLQGYPHKWISCPKCARKYHATAVGLLLRHIPLRYPRNQLYRDIQSLQRKVQAEYPSYPIEDLKHFLTPREHELLFPVDRTRSPFTLTWTPTAYDAYSALNERVRFAYQYTPEQLTRFRDELINQVPQLSRDTFLFCRNTHIGRKRIIEQINRTLDEYSQHQAMLPQWEAQKAAVQEQLNALLETREKQNKQLDELKAAVVIPWDTLKEYPDKKIF